MPQLLFRSLDRRHRSDAPFARGAPRASPVNSPESNAYPSPLGLVVTTKFNLSAFRWWTKKKPHGLTLKETNSDVDGPLLGQLGSRPSRDWSWESQLFIAVLSKKKANCPLRDGDGCGERRFWKGKVMSLYRSDEECSKKKRSEEWWGERPLFFSLSLFQGNTHSI
jgi:hypothetical protein